MKKVGRWLLIALVTCPFLIALTAHLLRSASADEFRPPDTEARRAAIGETKYSPEIQKRAFQESPLFQPKTEPEEMDWLANHEERGQTFDQFLRTRRNLFQSPRQIIYIQPLGTFDPDQTAVLADVAEYAAIFFQAKIRVQKTIDPSRAPDIRITSRQHPGPDDLQFLSTDVLKWLEQEMPKDAYARIAVTMTDLYPDPSWNFVFGQASTVNRVGVYSFARYGNPGDAQFLRRCLRVLAHETGHLFAIMHCVHYQCLMNGSNHLGESDATPLPLCPVCLRKLHAANAFDIRKRYEKLEEFFKGKRFDEEADWIKRRLAEFP